MKLLNAVMWASSLTILLSQMRVASAAQSQTPDKTNWWTRLRLRLPSFNIWRKGTTAPKERRVNVNTPEQPSNTDTADRNFLKPEKPEKELSKKETTEREFYFQMCFQNVLAQKDITDMDTKPYEPDAVPKSDRAMYDAAWEWAKKTFRKKSYENVWTDIPPNKAVWMERTEFFFKRIFFKVFCTVRPNFDDYKGHSLQSLLDKTAILKPMNEKVIDDIFKAAEKARDMPKRLISQEAKYVAKMLFYLIRNVKENSKDVMEELSEGLS